MKSPFECWMGLKYRHCRTRLRQCNQSLPVSAIAMVIFTSPKKLSDSEPVTKVPHPMDILTTRAGGVLAIEFNRPQKKNAITALMYGALADALVAAREEPAIRAVIIVGQRDVFTAGNDLQDFMHHPPSGGDSPVSRFLREIS